MYSLSILLPECGKDGCGCVSCLQDANLENCNLLATMASECRDALMIGKTIDLNRLDCEWHECERPYKVACSESERRLAFESLPKLQIRVTSVNLNLVSRTDRRVDIVSLEGGARAARKTSTTIEEALIHREVLDYLEDDEMALQLVPAFLGIEQSRKEGQYIYYMELVEGVVLGDTLDWLTDVELSLTLAVVHGLLDRLNAHLGFVHGDVSVDNIILRGWSRDRSKSYEVPIFDGETKITITLPFCPVLIDFGISSTRRYCWAWKFASPYRGTLMDVRDMYINLTPIFEGSVVERIQEKLGRVFGSKWRQGPRLAIPIPLTIEGLSHSSLLRLHLEEMSKSK
jgi:serine/threonine protein kinase